MDIATLVGIVAGFAFIIISIGLGKDGFAGISYFLDAPSAMITFGGAFAAIFTSYSIADFLGGLKSIKIAFKVPSLDAGNVIQKIIDLSNVARKEGLLSLEEAAGELDDTFLQKGIMLIVDGTDPDLVRGIMETELVSIDGRHRSNIGFWENLGSMGPAWGMIGTLLGLVMMLYHMDDVSSLGPNMAVALITTFYGSILANWLCIPIATKLKSINDGEMHVKEIIVEGLLSIQAGENPRVIEEKLKSFLSPKVRGSIGKGEEGGEE
ncbi:MAG: motility protein A [Lachnospiraceae bacterium]|nr:motility protein A [Lachnospiraceae bacterium]MBR5766449.1 motility protein A [Lachnospiraceae bacterium]MBR6486707.1 motility protein A [Lachnospiraceae bacterium]